MKRSSQVLLVAMGVVGATAVGHQLAPPNECVQQDATARPSAAQEATEPCRRSSGSGARSGSSRSHTGTPPSSSDATSAPSVPRGGFGSTGHAFASGFGS